MPYVIGSQKCFPVVDSIEAILTEDLLEVATGAANIVDVMGTQFKITKADMEGNIQKIRNKYVTNKEKFKKLKDLLQDEKEKKEDKDDKSGTVGSLWLKRGLEYLCEIFWDMIQEYEKSKQPGGKSDSGAVKKACQNAYDKTLKKYHNIATKMIVQGAFLVSPSKETFLLHLAKEEKDKEDQVIEEMKAYEPAYRAYMIVLGQLFQSFEYKDEILVDTKGCSK